MSLFGHRGDHLFLEQLVLFLLDPNRVVVLSLDL